MLPEPIDSIAAGLDAPPAQKVPGFDTAAPSFALGKLAQMLSQVGILVGACPVLEGRAVELEQLAGVALRQPAPLQEGQGFALLRSCGYFFARYSCKASMARSRSASSRLRRPFSFSSSLSRCASAT